jgi:hypothetical protein
MSDHNGERLAHPSSTRPEDYTSFVALLLGTQLWSLTDNGITQSQAEQINPP